uniref:Uncharacterized protein n=1 Tax=Globisporangium ultimum (strain ATCC 200006 / CBS 805.95 / DAOM BR144) TaxID=431595 RepID=K3X1Z5_GLOUD
MAQVRADARARVYDYDAADDALTPLPPPPRPQARPSLGRGIPSATATRAAAHYERFNSSRRGAVDDNDGVAPQPAPVPHEHPLAALAHIDQRSAHPGIRVASKRLNPAFFNRERIAAFVEKGTRHELQEDDSDDQENANRTSQREQTLHSTRVLQHMMQQVAAQKEVRLDLEEEDKVYAATAASHWRHELHPLSLQTTSWPAQGTLHNEAPMDSALERARVRKVKKQVNPKWLQEQQDSANRPRGPLERDDELHLREQLMQTTVDELLTSRVLFDDEDAARVASFPAVHKPALPVYSSGTTGLPGCCFDAWSY